MKSGVSPVIAAVLLIAIAVMASVAVWYWVSPYTSQPALAQTGIKGIAIVEIYKSSTGDGCSAVSIQNTGGHLITNALFNLKDSITGKPVGENGTDPTYPVFINITNLGVGAIDTFNVSSHGTSAVKIYTNASHYEYAYDVATDSQNNIIVVGYQYTDLTDWDFLIIKYTSGGNIIWSKVISNGSIHEAAYSVAVDSSNNIIVFGDLATGDISATGDIVFKFDSNGNQLWNRTWSVSSTSSSPIVPGYDVAVDGSNNIWFFAKNSTDSSQNVIKYDSSGNFVTKFIIASQAGLGGFTYIYSIAADSSGNIYVDTQEGSMTGYPVVAKYNSIGVHQWNTTNTLFGIVYALAADSNGNVAAAGRYSSTFEVFYINSTGNYTWSIEYEGSIAQDVDFDSQNNIVATGYRNTGFYLTMKVNSSGDSLWNRTDDIAPGSAYAYSYGVSVDSSNNIVVTGIVESALVDIYTVKYDSNGGYVWSGRATLPFGSYTLRTSAQGLGDVMFTCN